MRNPPYITSDQLLGFVQQSLLQQGLDDSGAGTLDPSLFGEIYAAAEELTHSYLESRFSCPFTGAVPALVTIAVKTFCAENLWTRRGNSGDQNPFTKAADAIRDRMADVQNGKIVLSASVAPSDAGGAVEKEDSITYSGGRLPL